MKFIKLTDILEQRTYMTIRTKERKKQGGINFDYLNFKIWYVIIKVLGQKEMLFLSNGYSLVYILHFATWYFINFKVFYIIYYKYQAQDISLINIIIRNSKSKDLAFLTMTESF